MKPIEHISLLRGDLDVSEAAFEDHLAEFADKHYMQNEPYFGTEWTDLFLAKTRNERKKSLDKLAERYQSIANLEKHDGSDSTHQ